MMEAGTCSIRRIFSAIILAIIAIQAIEISGDINTDAYYLDEVSDLVVLDLSSFEYVSGGLNHSGISPWGSLYFGEVNETTKVSFKVMNNDGAQFKNVRVIFTVNWFDGVESDSNYVMYRDSATIDVPSGKGSKAGPLDFRWIPRYSGSYMFNISIHVPNDRYPVSDVIYGFGRNITTGAGNTYKNGYWIGTYSNDCSSMKGWSTEVSGGLEANNWHVSGHPLGLGEPTLHTSGSVFWVGNETSHIGPTSGVYSLISPKLDLTRFDDSAYSPEFSKGRPQIYFMYRYKGNVTTDGKSGKAGLYHYVSIDDGDTWEKLLDPQGRHVIIMGNTSSPIWDHPIHKSINGGSDRWGLDISSYQGMRINLKLEYRPSGYPETGYLLDDFILVGKERVDISRFKVVNHTSEEMLITPGSPVEFSIEIAPVSREDPIIVRAQVVGASSDIDPLTDIKIEPPITTLIYVEAPTSFVKVRLYARNSTRAGPGWIKVRLMAENTIRDIVFSFMMQPIHDLSVEVSGRTIGEISHGEHPLLQIYLNNSGNTQENIYIDFGSDQGLKWNRTGPLQYQLQPGDRRIVAIEIDPGSDDIAGSRIGYLITYRQAIEKKGDQIPGMIRDGNIPPDWGIWHLRYEYRRSYNISLIASTRYALIRDPPKLGTGNITFHIGIINNGNGNDRVRMVSVMSMENVNITISHPEYIDIRPRSMDTVIPVNVTIAYPISPGIYRFRVIVISEEEEDTRDNHVDLSIRIGREEIPNGVYIMNSTLTLEPARPVLGSESVISFEARSFGLSENIPFNVYVRRNGSIISTTTFHTTRGSPILCQISWIPSFSGQMNMTIGIEGSIANVDESTDMVQKVNISLKVHYIDLAIEWHSFPAGKDMQTNSTLDPGQYFFEMIVKNNGDISAELIAVNINVTSDAGDRITSRMNITRIDPGESTLVRIGPFDLQPKRKYLIHAQVPVIGRWMDMDPEDNSITGSLDMGVSPPGEPVWRDPVFLLASSGSLILLFILIIIMIYRRK